MYRDDLTAAILARDAANAEAASLRAELDAIKTSKVVFKAVESRQKKSILRNFWRKSIWIIVWVALVICLIGGMCFLVRSVALRQAKIQVIDYCTIRQNQLEGTNLRDPNGWTLWGHHPYGEEWVAIELLTKSEKGVSLAVPFPSLIGASKYANEAGCEVR